MKKISKLSVFLLLSLYHLNASATSLQNILRYALKEDPRVLEAKANVSIAETQTKISEAGHYPTFSVACLLYTSPSPRDATLSRMPSSA